MPKLGPFWDLVNLRFVNNQIEKIEDYRNFKGLETERRCY